LLTLPSWYQLERFNIVRHRPLLLATQALRPLTIRSFSRLFKEALEATKAAREVYRDAGMVQYETYFADRIKALEAEIAAVNMRRFP